MNWQLKKTGEMKLCIEAKVFTLQSCESGLQKVTGSERERERQHEDESAWQRVHEREAASEGERG